MSVTFVAAGTGAGGVGAVTPGMPAGATTDDLLLIVIEGEGEDASDDAVPTGGDWTLIESVASDTTGLVADTRCTVGWAWYDAGINLTVPDAGNHTLARVFAFRGVDSTDPIGAFTSGSESVNTSSHSVASGLTTEADNSLVAFAFTHGDDSLSVSGGANATLTDFASAGTVETSENSDGTIGLFYGTKATAGGAGTFSWTVAENEKLAWVAVELKEAVAASGEITYVGGDSYCTAIGAETSGSVTFPTVEDDDVAILLMWQHNGTDLGPYPDGGIVGWSAFATFGGGANLARLTCYRKTLTSAASGTTITPTWDDPNSFSLLLMVFRGVDTTTPIDAVSAFRRIEGTSTATFPALSTNSDNTMVIASVFAKDPITQGGGFPPPSGFTQALDEAGTNQYDNAASFYVIRATESSVAPGDVSLGTTTDWATISIALTAAAEPEPPAPPVITADPSNLTVTEGTSGSLEITATGATSYQWYKGASGVTTTPVSGATSATLTKTWALADAGTYWCRATNSEGSDDSTAATVTVNPAPPTSEVTFVGADAEASGLNGDTEMTLTFPAGVVDGDYALLSIQQFSGTDRGVPIGDSIADWDLIANVGGGSWTYRTTLYGRALSDSDASTNITVTLSGNSGWNLILQVFRGVDTDDPINAISAHRTGIGSSTVTFAAVTTDDTDTAIVPIFACKDPITQGGGFAPPSGYTETADTSGTNQYRNGAAAWKQQESAGEVTPGNSTLGRTSDWASITVALNSGISIPPITVDPSGFTAIPSALERGIDFRPGPSEEHLAVIREGGGTWVMALELIDAANGEPIWSTVATAADEAKWWGAAPDGPVRYTRGRAAQSSFGVTVPLDENTLELMPRGTGHPAHPMTRNLLRAWAGHRLSQTDELLPITTLVVDEAEVVDTSGEIVLRLSAVDGATLDDSSFGPGGLRVEAGTNIVEEVVRQLERVLPPMAVITAESTNYTFPKVEKEEGDSVASFITEALASVGMELTTDELGRFVIAQVPPTWASSLDPAEWIYGDDGIPVQDVVTRFVIPGTPAGVKLSGGSVDEDEAEVSVTVYDQDPNSLTYWDASAPPPWATLDEVTNEYISNDAQAKTAAWAHFRRAGQGGQVVTFKANPNPALRPDQVVEFGHANTDVAPGLWKVQDVAFPIYADGLMDVTIARSWDPAQEDAEIGDPEPPSVGVTTASDDFNYGAGDNGFLYNYPNWRTQGNDTIYPRANKVLGGQWRLGGMGRWDTQMTSTDHWAELKIDSLHSDTTKGLGPIVRCDSTGSTIVGYSATVVYNGGAKNKIELRRWASKFVYEVIGTYTHSANLEGATVRIQAIDDQIKALVNGTVVIEVTDTVHTSGRWVGFHISYAWGDDWAAGVF